MLDVDCWRTGRPDNLVPILILIVFEGAGGECRNTILRYYYSIRKSPAGRLHGIVILEGEISRKGAVGIRSDISCEMQRAHHWHIDACLGRERTLAPVRSLAARKSSLEEGTNIVGTRHSPTECYRRIVRGKCCRERHGRACAVTQGKHPRDGRIGIHGRSLYHDDRVADGSVGIRGLGIHLHRILRSSNGCHQGRRLGDFTLHERLTETHIPCSCGGRCGIL